MIIVNEVMLIGMIRNKYPELYDYCKEAYDKRTSDFLSLTTYIMFFIEMNISSIDEPKDVMDFIDKNYLEISLRLL